jgi:hypothetical protein
MQGFTLWTIWIARNDAVFNQVLWTQQRLAGTIWASLIKYGKLAWLKVRQAKGEKARAEALDRFDSTWTQNEYLCHQEGMMVH